MPSSAITSLLKRLGVVGLDLPPCGLLPWGWLPALPEVQERHFSYLNFHREQVGHLCRSGFCGCCEGIPLPRWLL